jgi:hypothetical protein
MVPTTTTTTTPHIPGHHRRISALKNTTINFFKGYNKVSSPSSQLGPRSELTISTPIRFINEDLLSPHSQDLASPTRAGVKPSFDNKTCNSHPPIAITNSSYSKPVSSFTGPSSSISKDTLGQSSSLAGAEIIEETPIAPPMNDNGRAKSPSHSRSSGDNETPAVNEKVGSSNLSGAGKKHAKFRMALSILRRRSNPNLPRGDTHVESAEEENTGEKGLATFNVSYTGYIYFSRTCLIGRIILGADMGLGTTSRPRLCNVRRVFASAIAIVITTANSAEKCTSCYKRQI